MPPFDEDWLPEEEDGEGSYDSDYDLFYQDLSPWDYHDLRDEDD